MKVGSVVRESFAAYFREWWHLVPVAFFLYFFLLLAEKIVESSVHSVLASLVFVFLTFLGYTWLQAIHVQEGVEARDGHVDSSIGAKLRATRGRVGTLAVASVISAVGIVVGMVLLVVPGLFLLTRWSMVVPAIVIERKGVLAAFRRSRELVRGNAWRVFGAIAVTYVLVIIVAVLVTVGVERGLGEGSHEMKEFVSELLFEPLTAPFVILVWTSMFFRLRDAHAAETELAAVPAPAAA